MALTATQKTILHAAAQRYGAAQSSLRNTTWLADLVTANTAQKAAALTPYINEIEAEAQAALTQAPIDYQQQIDDAESVKTALNVL
jgi:hypothetical protein